MDLTSELPRSLVLLGCTPPLLPHIASRRKGGMRGLGCSLFPFPFSPLHSKNGIPALCLLKSTTSHLFPPTSPAVGRLDPCMATLAYFIFLATVAVFWLWLWDLRTPSWSIGDRRVVCMCLYECAFCFLIFMHTHISRKWALLSFLFSAVFVIQFLFL